MGPFSAGSGANMTFFRSASLLYLLLGGAFDIAMVAGFVTLRNRNVVRQLAAAYSPWLERTGLTLSAVLVTLWLVYSLQTPGQRQPKADHGKVVLFPCRTTHTRLFPKKHSFSYSYLVVGIPVGWEGAVGGMVSAGVKNSGGFWSWLSPKAAPRKGWYDVDASDYLERGNGHLGLRGKLDAYLDSQVGSNSKGPRLSLTLSRASIPPSSHTPTWLRRRGFSATTSTLSRSGTCTTRIGSFPP